VAEPLGPEHLALAVARLAEIAHELGEISTWLVGREDRPAECLDCASRDAAAAAFLLEQASRPRPGGDHPPPGVT
jgi:hypothetical protein